MEVIRLSSKGQVVIPKSIRDRLNLKEGDRLIAFARGNVVVLRKLREEESILDLLSKPVREKISRLGVEREEVERAVSWARRAAKKD